MRVPHALIRRTRVNHLELLRETIEKHGGQICRNASGFHVQAPQFFPDTARTVTVQCMDAMTNPLVRRFQFAAPTALVADLYRRLETSETSVAFLDGNTITLAPRHIPHVRRRHS